VYGDYPYYLPNKKEESFHDAFTGWMLLNYNKPILVSSTLGGYEPNYAVDETLRLTGVQLQEIKANGYSLTLVMSVLFVQYKLIMLTRTLIQVFLERFRTSIINIKYTVLRTEKTGRY